MGKLAFISGASRGIGRAVSTKLAEDGFELVLSSRNEDGALTELCHELNDGGFPAEVLEIDLSRPLSLDVTATDTLKSLRVDAFVHCAGISVQSPLPFQKPSEINRIFDINLISFICLAKIIVRSMIKNGGGKIVSVASIAAHSCFAGEIPYSASKAGLVSATKAIANEYGKFGIRSNSVSPGLIRDVDAVDIDEDILATIPLGRAGLAAEVADVISFLLSERSSYISGADIPITGGA